MPHIPHRIPSLCHDMMCIHHSMSCMIHTHVHHACHESSYRSCMMYIIHICMHQMLPIMTCSSFDDAMACSHVWRMYMSSSFTACMALNFIRFSYDVYYIHTDVYIVSLYVIHAYIWYMVIYHDMYSIHIFTWQCKNLSTWLLACLETVLSSAFSPTRHRMCHVRSGDMTCEGRSLSTVLQLRHTHEFYTICTLYALIFTYYTWFWHPFESVDSETYFRLFVVPATSASEARSMRMRKQSCALTVPITDATRCRLGAKCKPRRPDRAKPG